MARKPRLHIPGGVYHVTLRGNGRQPIFFDAEDRNRWESLLANGLHRYQHRIHAYCWMTNHVHLAIQAHSEPLARCVAFVASQYARMTNKKTGRCGHLFERRYGAVLVQADTHLKELVRYIHLNPVRAGIASTPGGYRWSSHRAYLSTNGPDWLTLDWVLSMFGAAVGEGRRRYADFMQMPVEESLWAEFRNGSSKDSRILGSDGFLRAVTTPDPEPDRAQSLDGLIEKACRQYGVTEGDVAAPSRVRRYARLRAEIGLVAVDGGVASLAAVARRFNRCPSAICRGINQLRTEGRKRNK
jgi:putative transposase